LHIINHGIITLLVFGPIGILGFRKLLPIICQKQIIFFNSNSGLWKKNRIVIAQNYISVGSRFPLDSNNSNRPTQPLGISCWNLQGGSSWTLYREALWPTRKEVGEKRTTLGNRPEPLFRA
jgi:hypothetical protein